MNIDQLGEHDRNLAKQNLGWKQRLVLKTQKQKKKQKTEIERTLLRHQQVNVLNNIKEQFITSVLDPFTTPADLSRNL